MDVGIAEDAGKIFLALKHVAWTWVFVYFAGQSALLKTDKELHEKNAGTTLLKFW